jgi:hypothetical protein
MPGSLAIVIDEYFIHENDPALMVDVLNWLECALFSKPGRAVARRAILRALTLSGATPTGDAPTDSPNVGDAPPHGSSRFDDHPTGVKLESSFANDATFQNELKFASKRAAQLLQGQASFDGISNPNAYSVFKFDIREIVLASGSSVTSLVSFECVLAALRGTALREARRFISLNNLYHYPDRVAKLWRYLDSLYLTSDCVRFLSELFNSCQQRSNESVAAFISRFQRIALIWKDQYS